MRAEPEPAAATVPAATVAMLLADARLPSGGHAHSAGVEPALMGGLAPGDLPELLRIRARTTTLVETGTAVVTSHRLDAGLPVDDVEAAWAARTPSPALREASRLLARGYLRVAGVLLTDRAHPASAAVAAWSAQSQPPPRALVLGAIAAGTNLPPIDLARLAVYDDVAAATGAIAKLEPADPLDLLGLVAATCADVDPLLPEVAAATEPHQIPAHSAPQSEHWAQAHAVASRRLFRA